MLARDFEPQNYIVKKKKKKRKKAVAREILITRHETGRLSGFGKNR